MKEPLPQRAWTLVVRYREELHRYFLRRMRRQRQEVADLTQEVFLRLLRMEEKECMREPLAYLYTVAHSVVVDYAVAERQARHVTVNSEALEEWANDPDKALPDTLAERLNMQRQLEKALREIPPLQAQALMLHYVEGLYCHEIAKRLGLSEKSIDKYLARGKAHLSQMLWDY